MQLPESELAVMEMLWADAPRTSEALIAELGETRGWQPSTVKTLLARLVRKGALQAEPDGRRFLYSPALPREQFLNQATRHFLDTLFGGRLTPLVAHLSDQRALSAADRKALVHLLQDLEQKHGR